jgi:hypothetical protein
LDPYVHVTLVGILGIKNVDSVESGAAQAEALGTRLVPAEDVHRLVVHV